MRVLLLLLAPGTQQGLVCSTLQMFPEFLNHSHSPRAHRPTGLPVHSHYRAITSSFWLIGSTRLRRKKPAFQRMEQGYFLAYGECRSQSWYLFILETFAEAQLNARHDARCWGYSRKPDMVSAMYTWHSDWPLCSSSQLSIKKCPTCKSDFAADVFDHNLALEQHLQTLSLNCPICDKTFPAKEKQIFEDHVFCHTL